MGSEKLSKYSLGRELLSMWGMLGRKKGRPLLTLPIVTRVPPIFQFPRFHLF